ncbi:MAG: PDZ domain-containing protein [Gemmatimonadales bacterium]
MARLFRSPLLAATAVLGALPATAQQPRSAPAVRASVSGIQYQIAFDSAAAARRRPQITLRFEAAAAGPVHLSLPAWTPGAYEISDFARKVASFSASSGGRPLSWDKSDYDTWRVRVAAPGPVEVRFDYLADSLDNAMAWSTRDFLLLNGTNVFLYPDGIGLDFPAQVTVRTESGWIVATGMDADGPGRYRATNYHDLVDMPFFIGRIDVDSAQVDGRWHRLASYPAGTLRGLGREVLWEQIRKMMPPMAAVWGETPFRSYTTLLIFDAEFGGGSALEHQNSHVGIYNPQFIGTPLLASITAHEIVHAWNVKRLRPADLVPYRYDGPQQTPLLWVSEGITDYYADLVLVRSGIIDSTVFLNVTNGKIENVGSLPPVALEDASLSTWIQPTDGTATIYYDKGSLAGLLLDIMIRDASDNRRSLDHVMRALYDSTWKRGRGFTTEEFLAAASRAAGGKSFADFHARYVDGRDPYPWAETGRLAGLRWVTDTSRVLRVGVSTAGDSARVVVTELAEGGAAAAAGVQPGDELVRVGDVEVRDQTFGERFRARYATTPDGTTVPLVVRREGTERTLSLQIRRVPVVESRLEFGAAATPKAARIRAGLLRGTTDR